MVAKRKNFVCEVCGKETSSTIANYYRQKKKYKLNRCSECAKKAAAESIKNKFATAKTNKTKITVECPICNSKRKISVRSSKRNRICKSCSAKIAHTKNLDKYKQLSNNRKKDNDFKKSVSLGIMKLDKNQRIQNAKNASLYWNDQEKKDKILKSRDTEEYRNKLKKPWQDENYKLKMSKMASERALNLWQDENYRSKMAVVRSKQLILKQSKQQRSLYSILDDLNIKYKEEYVIGPWSFDCFLPDYNILIEVQGDYWHSLPKAIRLDKSKSTYINEYYPQYKVIYFYEHEFYQNNAIIERLKHEIGINKIDQINFNFSDIKIKIVDADIINNFMYKYHYIGPKNHSLNIAYFVDDTIIACCSFSPITRVEIANRLKFNRKEIRELSRFAIHPKYQKKNFASWAISKSIKWIKKNKNWKLIISFADETIGHKGVIYKASNFKYDGQTDPSYYYISKTGYVMHKKTLYNRAVKMSMKEKEFSDKYQYKKVKSGVKHRYLYKLD